MELSRRIWRIGTVITLIVFLLSARLVYWQLVRGAELQPINYRAPQGGIILDRLGKLIDTTDPPADGDETSPTTPPNVPQPVIQRTSDMLRDIERGTIYDRNGRALAYTVTGEDGERTRVYTEPSLGTTLGYVLPSGVGVSGVEQAFNDTLLGLDRPDTWWSQLVHRPIVGSDVYLTIDSHIQRQAVAALGDRAGAIVVLDPLSGEVLALASNPGFDPNQISDPAYMSSLIECADASCEAAFVNRGVFGLYPPGSTWKTITLAASLDSGQVTMETVFDFGQPRQGPDGIYYVYEVDGAEMIDPNHEEPRLDLASAYAVSANAAFARMGDEMDPAVFQDYAGRMGFGREDGPPLEIGATPAQLAYDPAAITTNNVLRAATAFGQGELLTSPLSMALVAGGITAGGTIMSPHLLQRVVDPEGRLQETGVSVPWISDVIRPETAQDVAAIMVNAVRNGSGVLAAVPGAVVGGKTGTAEVGDGLLPHAWFVGFAHENERTVTIAVILEHAGEGADVAAPVFAQIARVALRELGQPVEE
jgi:peptidoglycan glycosyltransferase